jgi:hypothetical protein
MSYVDEAIQAFTAGRNSKLQQEDSQRKAARDQREEEESKLRIDMHKLAMQREKLERQYKAYQQNKDNAAQSGEEALNTTLKTVPGATPGAPQVATKLPNPTLAGSIGGPTSVPGPAPEPPGVATGASQLPQAFNQPGVSDPESGLNLPATIISPLIEAIKARAAAQYKQQQDLAFTKEKARASGQLTTIPAQGFGPGDEVPSSIADAYIRAQTPAKPGRHVVKGVMVDDNGKVLYTAPGGMEDGNLPGNMAFTGKEYVASLPPKLRDVVQSALNGNIPVTLASKRAGGMNQLEFASILTHADPNFRSNDINLRFKTQTEYNPQGKIGVKIGSVNTAIKHAADLSDAVKGLNNYQIRAINTALLAGKRAIGDPAVDKFLTIAHSFATETAAALKGGAAAPATSEIKDQLVLWAKEGSPAQLLDGVLKPTVKLLGSRIDTFSEQYEDSMGKKAKKPFITKNTRKALEKIGVADYFPAEQEEDTAAEDAFVNEFQAPR